MYKILHADTMEKLEDQVISYLVDKWELAGGVIMSRNGDYVQAVTKNERKA